MNLCTSKFTQSLQLTSIPLEKVVNLRTETDVGDGGTHDHDHQHGEHAHDAINGRDSGANGSSNPIYFSDDRILNYYQTGLDYR